ncbi:MAG TPA: DUF5777 family beta-barrel protein [Chitinophagaceae bacterium]|nr:DUF5777 family beta-barrel protein [Chitinophagaceae bacterium]
MIKTLLILFLFFPFLVFTQDKKPVQVFTSEKAINANTTQVVAKGKMAFKVTHNFGDIAGDNGGAKRFFGLDNSADIRIAFTTGIANRLDMTLARAKGAGFHQQLYELGLKYQLLQQLDNDPSHPLAVTLFANNVISANKASTFPDQDNSFRDFSDRLSQVIQLIIARRLGKISVQLNPTFVTRGYAASYDKKSMFALGGALRLPLGARMNLVMDYFHPFRDEASKNAFKANDNIKFYDPLGIGFEVLTAGHTFRLNFTNATEILENRFIPRTITSWGEGEFRWGFTITRNFTLWR